MLKNVSFFYAAIFKTKEWVTCRTRLPFFNPYIVRRRKTGETIDSFKVRKNTIFLGQEGKLVQYPGQEKEQFDLQEKKGKHNHLLFALYLLHTRWIFPIIIWWHELPLQVLRQHKPDVQQKRVESLQSW